MAEPNSPAGTDTNGIDAGEARIANELSKLVKEIQKDSQKDRRLVYGILIVMALAIATVGVSLWRTVNTMNESMVFMK